MTIVYTYIIDAFKLCILMIEYIHIYTYVYMYIYIVPVYLYPITIRAKHGHGCAYVSQHTSFLCSSIAPCNDIVVNCYLPFLRWQYF